MHIFEEQIIWQFQKAFFENLGIFKEASEKNVNFRGGLLSDIFF